jgi:hypothetical protein
MGGGESKKAEVSGVEQSVVISNEDPIKFHSEEMLFVLYALAIMKAAELIYYFKKNYEKNTKEKLARSLNV